VSPRPRTTQPELRFGRHHARSLFVVTAAVDSARTLLGSARPRWRRCLSLGEGRLKRTTPCSRPSPALPRRLCRARPLGSSFHRRARAVSDLLSHGGLGRVQRCLVEEVPEQDVHTGEVFGVSSEDLLHPHQAVAGVRAQAVGSVRARPELSLRPTSTPLISRRW